MKRLRGTASPTSILVASALLLAACGEECVGYSSFTDENGLIVFVGCDGSSFVATPTPGSAMTSD